MYNDKIIYTVKFECFRSCPLFSFQKLKSGVFFKSSLPKENGWDFKIRITTLAITTWKPRKPYKPWFRTQKSREHVACVYGSPEMLRMYLNDPKNELAKILFLEMKNTPNKVDLNSNNKDHRVETEVYTATHCGFKGRKKH